MIIKANIPETTNTFDFKNINFPYKPFRHQFESFSSIYENDLLLESPTSSGKTDAVAYPIVDQILNEKNWAVFVYPTRALLWDQFMTLKELGEKYNVKTCKINPFISVSEMENLFALNRIVIVTPDIFYYWFLRNYQHYERFIRIFFERVKHIVFDEVHLYDTYMLLNLKFLIGSLKELNENIRVHCLSATIEHVRNILLDIIDFRQIEGESFTGQIEISAIDTSQLEMNSQINSLLEERGKKVIILNSATRANNIYNVLKNKYDNTFFVVGTRYQQEEERIINLENFKKLDNSILVASPIVEQGIDFKANYVISEDACSLFSIIQRFGRIGRAGNDGRFVILANKKSRSDLFNKDKIISRSEFELVLEKEAKYFNPPLPMELEMMKAMLYKVYMKSKLKDVIGRAINIDSLKELYEKYENHLPSPSFREPSPSIKLKTENIVSIWDVLEREVWTSIQPTNDDFAIGYLNITPEEFLNSPFIDYKPQLNLIEFKSYSKEYEKSFGTGIFEIHGVEFASNGELYKRVVRNSFKVKTKHPLTPYAYFRPVVFFEEELDTFSSRTV